MESIRQRWGRAAHRDEKSAKPPDLCLEPKWLRLERKLPPYAYTLSETPPLAGVCPSSPLAELAPTRQLQAEAIPISFGRGSMRRGVFFPPTSHEPAPNHPVPLRGASTASMDHVTRHRLGSSILGSATGWTPPRLPIFVPSRTRSWRLLSSREVIALRWSCAHLEPKIRQERAPP